jgi:hypothetical protein
MEVGYLKNPEINSVNKLTYLNMLSISARLSGCPHHALMVCVAFIISWLQRGPVVSRASVTTSRYSERYIENIILKELH